MDIWLKNAIIKLPIIYTDTKNHETLKTVCLQYNNNSPIRID